MTHPHIWGAELSQAMRRLQSPCLETLNHKASPNEGVEYAYVYVDGQAHRKTEPSAFYSEILHNIDELLTIQDRSIHPVEEPKDKMGLTDLRQAISSFTRRGIRPVILIDEFDVLCENRNFDLAFFSGALIGKQRVFY